jgi:hypothetical protein
VDKNYLNYICVSGYGWTGSGACIDLLKEFKGVCAPQGEFRIIKDPYGIKDLEESLVHNWDFIRHDVAIKDFLNYCEIMGRETGLFKKSGKGFSKKLNVNFMKESHKYIDRMTNMSYYGDTFVHRYKVSAFENFVMKIRTKFGGNNAKKMYLSRPAEDFFIEESKRYIDKIFYQYAVLKKANKIVLDQAIPPTNIHNTVKYFNKIKLIIVDRDPRDIYVNMVKRGKLLGPELEGADSASKYIKWHKLLRGDTLSDDEHIFRINFEDLVFKYDESIKKIIDFLGGDMKHNKKGEYFSVARSINNVGLWKSYKDQEVMSVILDELPSYCHKY